MKQTLKRAPRHNLNRILIIRLEETGVEMKTIECNGGQMKATTKNPIEYLFLNGELTREEIVASDLYKDDFNVANQYRCSKPSYDGSSISAASTKKSENTPSQNEIDASRRVDLIKQLVANASRPRQISNFKEFKALKTNHRRVRGDLKLLQILDVVFEREIALRTNDPKKISAEKILKMNRRTIESRIKTICKILLDNSAPKNYVFSQNAETAF